MNKYKKIAYFHYLIEGLLCQKNISDSLKEIEKKFYDDNFYEVLDALIDVDMETGYYDDFTHKNLDILIDYLEKFDNKYSELVKKYRSYEKKQSADFYANQLCIKYNKTEEFINNKTFAWNISDMRESMIYDFMAYEILVACDADELVNKFQLFINQDKFIYFVNRILIQYPLLFKDQDFCHKCETIFECNLSLFKIAEEDVMKDYIAKNYDENSSCADVTEKYQRFLQENSNMLFKLKKGEIYDPPYNVLNYVNIYGRNTVINGLNGQKVNNSPLLLEHIIDYIRSLKDYQFTFEKKNELLSFLHSIRNVISKDQLDKYNEIIIYINSKLTMPSYENWDCSYLTKKLLKMYDVEKSKKINGKPLVMLYDEVFNYINNGENNLSKVDCYKIIKSLIKDYPVLFLDDTITDKSLELVKKNQKEILKNRINKIRKKRKV